MVQVRKVPEAFAGPLLVQQQRDMRWCCQGRLPPQSAEVPYRRELLAVDGLVHPRRARLEEAAIPAEAEGRVVAGGLLEGAAQENHRAIHPEGVADDTYRLHVLVPAEAVQGILGQAQLLLQQGRVRVDQVREETGKLQRCSHADPRHEEPPLPEVRDAPARFSDPGQTHIGHEVEKLLLRRLDEALFALPQPFAEHLQGLVAGSRAAQLLQHEHVQSILLDRRTGQDTKDEGLAGACILAA
mmetsp:Transcript_73785/g.213499  ORF Transcript_73785/g.213499 Transcript_73785/m.213499 type:complete len:242 (-) Transcript_73785:1263-1988(-)